MQRFIIIFLSLFFFLSSPHDVNILESTSKSRFFSLGNHSSFVFDSIVLKVQREMFLKQGRETSQYFKIFVK